ncbi:JAB domain-containing protein [Rhizorhapis sp. SPR117]|uniref:JAB domain-containing protein n=1 Tax=Rhizorhapis sp. SPR117 TaxID=2912611 RepID=UPI001F417732|nr:DNA repair protein [Rhizorhapis sp. SPR117]
MNLPLSITEFSEVERACFHHSIGAEAVDFASRQTREILTVAYIDHRGRIAHMFSRTDELHDSVSLSMRMIVHEALSRGHDRFLLLHNHPSGDPQPSRTDITTTRLMCRIAAQLELKLVDHLILSPHAYFSFRAAGLL